MRKLVVLAVLVLGAVYAYAGPTEFTFVAYSGGDWQNGYPYYITQTNGPVGQYYAVMCDDYAHGGMPGDQWEANITDLGSKNISLTRFNNLSGPNSLYPLGLYDQAGWILLQTTTEPTSEWQAMNYAVWHIFDPNAPLVGDAQSWLNAAHQEYTIGFPGVDFNKVYIVTPVDQHDPDPNSMQEFMYIGQDTTGGNSKDQPSTPEPGTLILLGTGVCAMFGRRFLN
jgi:hypothetical protein